MGLRETSCKNEKGWFVNAMNGLEKLLDSTPNYSFPLRDEQTVGCQLTTRIIILTRKLIVAKLLKKVVVLHITRRFITESAIGSYL
jgi:hypothetical protein